MMFDHDRLRHAFYVEESYVIPWMYPYLSPHGLIMKINRDQTPYDAKTAAKDRDFWDWYTRRLLDDPMYRRDFAGQKSFSKLRAAIAGLYVRQGRYREAAQAFREACLLYPASPEATFRYSQECLVPFRKWDVVLELMDYTDLIDPKNKRTTGLRGYVERVRAVTDEVRRLEALRAKGKLSDSDSLSLAHCYFEIGRARESAQIISSMADRLKDARELSMAWQILLSAGVQQDAEKLLARYLKLNPSGDANAWAELAKLQHRSGRRQAAQQSFVAGYNIDRQMMFQKIQKDQELYEIAAPLFQRRK
jgi:tetratricopeptide (TPR) repeat protein